jgi:hypothetical protein
VATAEQIREWRALRGRFLNALWDAEHDGNDVALVSDLLAGIGAPDLRDHQIERLVGNLSADRLIEGLTLASGPEQQVRPQQRRSLRGRGMVE